MYKVDQLKNGLRIVTKEMKGRDSVAIGLWAGVGGRHEEDRLKGAAHFLEHIVFKGSQKYSCDEIKEKIEGVGGTLNAFTSEEQTCFYAKIPAQHFKNTFDILADMVFFPKIHLKDVEKERMVIIEEIKMYKDLSQYLVIDLVEGLLWPKHPLGNGLAGSPETVGAMSNKDLKKFHQDYYRPENIVVSVCGNVAHQDVVRLVKKKLNLLKSQHIPDYLPATNGQKHAKVKFFRKPIEQMHVALAMEGVDENSEKRYALTLLNTILGGNMSSRLFTEIREKRGLAYSIGSSCKALHDTGMFLIRAGVDNQKIVETIDVIKKELRSVVHNGVNPDEFKRARDYLLGQLQLGLEDTMEHMLWVGDSLISKNKTRTLKSVIQSYNKVKRIDVQAVAKEIFQEDKYNLAIVGPLTASQEKQIKAILGVK